MAQLTHRDIPFILSRACSLLGGAAFGAVAHNAAHNVFLTLPAYASSRELEAPQRGRGPTRTRQGGPWSEEMPSPVLNPANSGDLGSNCSGYTHEIRHDFPSTQITGK